MKLNKFAEKASRNKFYPEKKNQQKHPNWVSDLTSLINILKIWQSFNFLASTKKRGQLFLKKRLNKELNSQSKQNEELDSLSQQKKIKIRRHLVIFELLKLIGIIYTVLIKAKHKKFGSELNDWRNPARLKKNYTDSTKYIELTVRCTWNKHHKLKVHNLLN